MVANMALQLKEKTILVIDDEPEILELVKEFLEEEYYHVLTAISGFEGLELLKKNKVHLVLLDIAMPKMNGLEVLMELKKNPETSTLPVLMLTGRLDTKLIMEATKIGAKDYITKPFNPNNLLKWIKVYEPYESKIQKPNSP